jgi:Polysaccharide lyase family 4, domain II/Polysaccharide lyase family 4, domain III
MRLKNLAYVLTVILLGGSLQLCHAQLTLTEVSSTDWKITNGAITTDFDPTGGQLWSMFLSGYSADNLVDLTQTGGDGHPKGLYMDNDGTCQTQGIGSSSTPTASYHLSSGHYLDWWISWPPSASCSMTLTLHYVVFPNDPTVWTYYVANHASTAAQGTFGQLQYLFRISGVYFTNTYQVNSGLNNLGGWSVTLPTITAAENADPGRAVQNAALDLHGITLPAQWGREFDTKYDFSTYEYLHQAQCAYGSQFGACSIFPSMETGEGGPTKQDLAFTGNILMGELNSNHLNNDSPGYVTTGNTTRIWGPVGFQFSEGQADTTIYTNAVNSIPTALTNLASDTILVNAGYVPTGGTARGNVEPFIAGGGSSSANTAWEVLSDPNTNMQYSGNGYQYWTANNTSGDATIFNVWPGTYRLSAYVLGEWGELRDDGVTVTANSTTELHGLTFTPENFSPSGDAPVWTIGTPDRSSHEFLHGKNNYGDTGSCSGCDDREYFGAWNYWADFAANHGSVVYYATAVGSTPATNNTLDWNYTQWNQFDPGLYDASNDSTDNYVNTIPTYVRSLAGATGTNGVTTPVPPWYVYFTTTSAQSEQGSFVDVSIGLSCVEANLTASLNGHALTWNAIKSSDCSVRSGFSGTYQWVVFEWPTSDLVAAGSKDTLELTVGGSVQGIQYDALRMEVSSRGANPNTTGWHDYEYVTSGTYIAANDAVSSNN